MTHSALSEKGTTVAYRVLAYIIRIVIPKWYLGVVTGLENLPLAGPFILIANHASSFDHVLLGSIIKIVYGKELYFLAKRELFRGVVSRTWCNTMGAIPIDRQKADTAAYRQILWMLYHSGIICIYPEGAIGPGDRLLPFQLGAFKIAVRTEVSIIPVGIEGSHLILPRGAIWPRCRRANVAFGKPLNHNSHLRQHDAMTDLADQSRKVIEELALGESPPTRNSEAISHTSRYLIDIADNLGNSAASTNDRKVRRSLSARAIQLLKLAQHNDPLNSQIASHLARLKQVRR